MGAIFSACWVGQGAQGAVVKAQWRSGCTVAVKWLVSDGLNVPAAYLEALLGKMLTHPYLVQTFDCAMCQLDGSFNQVSKWPLGPVRPARDSAAACPASAGASEALLDVAPSNEQLAVASTMDSFEGGQQLAGDQPVDCLDVLKQLGAAPGKYVVQIVSEWCDEGTLHAAIRKGVFRPQGRRSRTWALRALLRTAREVALGMCHLHSLNIIHGDLKPGNVLLKSSRVDSRGFVAKVADFGLSRLCGKHEDFVQTADWGTVPYMAGEYLDNKLCKSSDVYSFGVLLWQMYTGKAPFAGHLEAQVAVGVMMGSLQLEWPANMPAPLLRLGQSCCRHEPEQRPTFKECVVALAGLEVQVRDLAARSKALNTALTASMGFYGPHTTPSLGGVRAGMGCNLGAGYTYLGLGSGGPGEASAVAGYGQARSALFYPDPTPQASMDLGPAAVYGKACSVGLDPSTERPSPNPGPNMEPPLERPLNHGSSLVARDGVVHDADGPAAQAARLLQSYPQIDLCFGGSEASPGLLRMGDESVHGGGPWGYLPGGMPRAISMPTEARTMAAVAGDVASGLTIAATSTSTSTVLHPYATRRAGSATGPVLQAAAAALDPMTSTAASSLASAGGAAAAVLEALRVEGALTMAFPNDFPGLMQPAFGVLSDRPADLGSAPSVPCAPELPLLPPFPQMVNPSSLAGPLPPTELPAPGGGLCLPRPRAATGGGAGTGDGAACGGGPSGLLPAAHAAMPSSPSADASSSLNGVPVTTTYSANTNTTSCSGFQTLPAGSVLYASSAACSPAAALVACYGPSAYALGGQLAGTGSPCGVPSATASPSGLPGLPQQRRSNAAAEILRKASRGPGAEAGGAPSRTGSGSGSGSQRTLTPMPTRTASCVLLSDNAPGLPAPQLLLGRFPVSAGVSAGLGSGAVAATHSFQGRSALLINRQSSQSLSQQWQPIGAPAVRLGVPAATAATAWRPPSLPYGAPPQPGAEGLGVQYPVGPWTLPPNALGSACLSPNDGPHNGTAEGAAGPAGFAHCFAAGAAPSAEACAAVFGPGYRFGASASAAVAAAAAWGHRPHAGRAGLPQGAQLGGPLGATGTMCALIRGASSRRGSTGPTLQDVPEDDGDGGSSSALASTTGHEAAPQCPAPETRPEHQQLLPGLHMMAVAAQKAEAAAMHP